MACDLFEYGIVSDESECRDACTDVEKLNELQSETSGFDSANGVNSFLSLSTCQTRCSSGCEIAADLSWSTSTNGRLQ